MKTYEQLLDVYDPPKTHKEPCPYCDGRGDECRACHGHGYVIVEGEEIMNEE